MERFCTYCNKNFDFPVKGLKDLDNLVCPECGRKIDKNSRLVIDDEENDQKVASVLSGIFTFFWFFYLVLSLLGIGAYFLKWYMALYVLTGIILSVYTVQLVFGSASFISGIILIPAGAVAAYLHFKTIPGACLGIMAVFTLRHLIRDVIWRLIMTLVRFLSKLGG